jgi:hypothetical protein
MNKYCPNELILSLASILKAAGSQVDPTDVIFSKPMHGNEDSRAHTYHHLFIADEKPLQKQQQQPSTHHRLYTKHSPP